MLLTITYTGSPATDLGHLLHKHPERVQTTDLSFGSAHVFYPEVSADRCTAAILLEVDSVGAVRGPGSTLDHYVNDRPYVSSSMMSVALSRVFGTAMSGRSKDRQELADRPIPLECRISAVRCRPGSPFVREVFEPLGYQVSTREDTLDPEFEEWGPSPYLSVELKGTQRLRDLLEHIYVLIPVLDDAKHYWVGDDEVEKLLRRGAGWLETHPIRERIVRRYLRHQRALTREAVRLLAGDEASDPDTVSSQRDAAEAEVERAISLNEQRIGSVISALRASKATSVVDLGCGEGRLLVALTKVRELGRIAGLDVSSRALERAEKRLRLDQMAPAARDRFTLMHGSLLYRDERLAQFEAATLIEVIEHLDPPRFAAFERVVFEHARPRVVIVTTPNREYNELFPNLPAGKLRHGDHRFEWTRREFENWTASTGRRFGYECRFLPVGTVDPNKGPPTQMAIFERTEAPSP